MEIAVIPILLLGGIHANTESNRDYAKALVVVGGHLVHKVDLPGEVFAHRFFAALTALTGGEHDVYRLARHPGCARFEWQAGTHPDRSAARQDQGPNARGPRQISRRQPRQRAIR
jgi:hypothetical protein